MYNSNELDGSRPRTGEHSHVQNVLSTWPSCELESKSASWLQRLSISNQVAGYTDGENNVGLTNTVVSIATVVTNALASQLSECLST